MERGLETIPAEPNRLGECPLWCDRTRRLFWVDVLEPALWSFDPAAGACVRHSIRARRLGSIGLRAAGGLLLACENGLWAYDPTTGRQDFLVDPEPGMPGHRKNDGRADPAGNFWIGTLEEGSFSPVGRLYKVTPELRVSVEAEGIAVPNSLAFDAVRRRMYFADTRAHAIQVRDYDAATGEAGAFRVFARTRPPARPDGSCVDAEGFLWNAEYAGGRVVRYAPSGSIAAAIDLPVSHPTCCCFGGPDLDVLFVTSAAEPLSAEQRRAEPLAGRLICLRPGVRGQPESRARL